MNCLDAYMKSAGTTAILGGGSGGVLGNATPSPNKFRKYMLNVTSSVLGKMTPQRWRAELLLNEYQYNHSWDGMNAQFGFKDINPATGLPYAGAGTGTYDDAIIAKYEKQFARGGTGGRPFAAPVGATTGKLVKLVNGVSTAVSFVAAAQVGFAVGSYASESMGWDANGALCSPTFEDGGVIGVLTGQDCSYLDYDASYVYDSDATFGQTTQNACVQKTSVSFALGTNGTVAQTSPECNGSAAENWYRRGSLTPKQMCGPLKDGVRYIASATKTGNVTSVSFGWTASGSSGPNLTQVCPDPSPQTWSLSTDQASFYGYCINTNGRYQSLSGQSTLPNRMPVGGGASSFSFTCSTGQKLVVLLGSTNWNKTVTPETASSLYGVAYVEGAAILSHGEAKPKRYLKCSMTFTVSGLKSRKSAEFTEDQGMPQPLCPVPSSKADRPTGSIVLAECFVADNACQTIGTTSVSQEYGDWFDTYPECRGGQCKLDLEKKDGARPWASCFDLENVCAGWWKDDAKTDHYQCVYGTHDVSINECKAYARLFKPEAIDTCSPYADPSTGEWSGGKNGDGCGKTTTTGTTTATEIGTGLTDPETREACNGDGNGFDPAGFIVGGLKCIMEWAFVPRPTVIEAEASAVTHSWDSTIFGQVPALVSPFESLPIWDGCEGIPIYIEIHWPLEWVLDWNFGAACDAPMADTAATVRAVGGGILGLLGIIWLVNSIGSAIGMRGVGKDA